MDKKNVPVHVVIIWGNSTKTNSFGNFPVSQYLYDESCLHVRIFMIMASTHWREWETVLVENLRWTRGNIGYIDPAAPLTMRDGREHYLVCWENTSYDAEYVDCLYVCKMADISKMKCTWYSPDEVGISPEQCVTLKGFRKSRTLGRRLFEESSSPRWRIVEEDDTLELNLDPFAELPPEETLQAKAPPIESQQAAKKKAPKPLPEERLRLQAAQRRAQAAQRRSPQVGEEDVQASKPLAEGRKKSPAWQENSKQSSWRRRLITEETLQVKAQPIERLEAAKKKTPKPLPEERLRLQAAQRRAQAAQRRSLQVGEEDVQASKPLAEGRKKSPALQEISKQSSWRRRLITEETLQAKAQPIERLEAAKKKTPKPLPEERLRLQAAQRRAQAAQRRSLQVGEEDVQASKPLAEGRKKSPALQEISKQSSWRRRLITEETLQAKAPPIERLEAAKKKAPKPLPEERLRLQAAQRRAQAAQRRAPQVGEEDVQASKPLAEGRKKSPALQEKSKQSRWRRRLITEETLQAKAPPIERLEAAKKVAPKPPPEERLSQQAAQRRAQAAQRRSLQEGESSWRRRFITEEDDKMFPCNIDPFSEEMVDENEAAESDQSSQEDCF